MSSKQGRDYSIDFLKGITAILMVLPHVGTALIGQNKLDPNLLPIYSFINVTSFTTLFFLSGVGIYLSVLHKELNKEEAKLYRVKLLLVD
jgi:fucose 4-O-acetylase-like acetyltransferase